MLTDTVLAIWAGIGGLIVFELWAIGYCFSEWRHQDTQERLGSIILACGLAMLTVATIIGGRVIVYEVITEVGQCL